MTRALIPRTAVSVGVTATAMPFGVAMSGAEVWAFVSSTNCRIKQESPAALVYADTTFTAVAATDVCTHVAHGLLTGDGPFQLTTTVTLPAGLSLATNYWIIKIDADTFYIATTLANAIAGTRVDITTTGTGVHTISDTTDTVRRPLADSTSMYVPANTIVYLPGQAGSDVSVLRHTADGSASIACTRGL